MTDAPFVALTAATRRSTSPSLQALLNLLQRYLVSVWPVPSDIASQANVGVQGNNGRAEESPIQRS